MKKTLRRALAAFCVAVMILAGLAPAATANAKVISSGDEWLTTQNGFSVKLTVMFNGENGAAVLAGLNQDQFDFGASNANYADVFDSNTNTGVILRDGSGTWDGTLLAGDYIQVDFKDPIDLAKVTFKFDAGSEGNDKFYSPVFSYSEDGETWTNAGTLQTGTIITYEGEHNDIQAIRLTNSQAARAWIKLLDIEMEAQLAEPGPNVSEEVQAIMDNMTLEQKISQMMMVDFRKWGETPDVATDFTVMNDQVKKIIEDYDFGSIILFANNIKETEQSFNLVSAMQEAAIKDNGIALLIAADQEGGNVYRLGSGTALPGNMALGATFDPENAKLAGQIIGRELGSLGINTNLAPVVDVNNNANNPVIGLRSYGDDATAVGEMAAASIQGMAEYNVIGCAKHFPGHGDTATDSHYGLPSVDKSLDILLENELKPYEVAIKNDIEMIMTAHILYPQLESDKILSNKTGEEESLPATMSDDILTGLLKEDMRFDGIIVTDAMNMAGIADKWDKVQSVVVSIQAGADMICMPCQLYCETELANLDAILAGVKAAVETGEIPIERINDAVARILTVKESRGLLDFDLADYTLEKALTEVGSDENRAIEREIAAKAITVVKNTDNVLPLDIKEDTNLLMLVPYNNERAQMLMGWNRAKEAGLIPKGAEVDYFAFSSSTTMETPELVEKLEWADIVIINSEISNTARMEYKHWLSKMPNDIVNYCAENDKISVISSVDKPYDVQMYPNADAIVAAYGCKGSSVDPTEALIGGATGSKAAYGPNIIAAVEVILGVYGASGKLPVTVPRYDVESNSYTDEVVYPRGYGLTYEAKEPIQQPTFLFDDVQDENEYFFEPVYWAVENGITTGTSATTFSPEDTCTRGAVVTFLWRAAGCPEPEAKETAFVDITEADYYYKAVLWAVEEGITTGTSATTFAPNEGCTRGQVVTFLFRAANEEVPVDAENAFTDVVAGAYYEDAVLWAVANGITTGTSATTFEPDANCTRGQIVTFIYRAE